MGEHARQACHKHSFLKLRCERYSVAVNLVFSQEDGPIPGEKVWRFHGMDESLSFLADFMQRHGPFDGLMGFSQVDEGLHEWSKSTSLF